MTTLSNGAPTLRRAFFNAWLVASVFSGWLAMEGTALAQSPPRGAPVQTVPLSRWGIERPLETRWYGYQTVITDVAALGMFVGAASTFRLCISLSSTSRPCDNTTSETLALAGLTTYGLGGPIVHGAHGHWGKAGMSFGMRAAPFLLAALSATQKANEATGVILIGGMFAAMSLDAALLANEEVEPERPSFTLAPAYDPRARAGALVVQGAF
jgi:hypothetical protein